MSARDAATLPEGTQGYIERRPSCSKKDPQELLVDRQNEGDDQSHSHFAWMLARGQVLRRIQAALRFSRLTYFAKPDSGVIGIVGGPYSGKADCTTGGHGRCPRRMRSEDTGAL